MIHSAAPAKTPRDVIVRQAKAVQEAVNDPEVKARLSALGLLTDTLSWRWVFVINVVPIALTLILLAPFRNERPATRTPIDVAGAVLGAVGLGGVVFALIEQANYGWSSPVVLVPLAAGALALGGFLWRQATAPC